MLCICTHAHGSCRIALLRIDHEALCVLRVYCKDTATRFGTFEHFANNIDSISFLLTTFYGALCREGKNAGYFKSSLSKTSEEYRRDPSTEQLIVPPCLKNMEQIEDIVCGTCPTTVKLSSITFFTTTVCVL